LGTLESLSTEVALVGLKRDVYANVGSNMVSLDGGSSAGSPRTSKAKVIGALASNVDVAEMVLSTTKIVSVQLHRPAKSKSWYL
jgi:hypothetical protein